MEFQKFRCITDEEIKNKCGGLMNFIGPKLTLQPQRAIFIHNKKQ